MSHGRRQIIHLDPFRLHTDLFEAGELQRARVTGKAELLSRLPEKEEEGEEPRISVNRVEGEELRIFFAGGKIAEVEIGPGVEGRYLPGKDR